MAIRRNVPCFVGGSLRKVDLDEKGRILGADHVGSAASAPGPAPEMNRNQVMAALKAAGIKFKATIKVEEMRDLLAKGAPAPAEPVASLGYEAKGTGDEDVI